MSKEECRIAVEEDLTKYRTRDNYNEAIKKIEDSCDVKLKETKGIKYACSLNNLKYFHIIDNYNVDIMHDLYEGTVPFLIQNLIGFCVNAKVFKFEKVASYVQSYDYGKLNRHNTPSTLLDKPSVGQNSSQVRCLMLHLPYIFYDFKLHEAINTVWISVTTMLDIIRIVHSSDLFEQDLCYLEDTVKKHLESIKLLFKKNLLPKHHFMTHYATVIRLIGPIVHMSTMRYETKHKAFTDEAKKTNNFMNIGHYIAVRHQQKSSLPLEPAYQDDIKFGKIKLLDLATCPSYVRLLCQRFQNNVKSLNITNWAQINSNHYFKTLFLIYSNSLYEIDEIIYFKDNFYFVCTKYDIIEHNVFLNSIKVKKILPNVQNVFKHSELKCKKSFERKHIDADIYIILDSMELFRLIENDN